MITKVLGIIALLGAPFLAIGIYGQENHLIAADVWWVKCWGIVYISGWMAGIEALRRLNVTIPDHPANPRFGRTIGWVLLTTLFIADLSSTWEFVATTYKPTLFWALDMCWPLSNLLMLPFGIAVVRAKRLSGWQRWVPLAVGCWLPIVVAFKQTSVGLTIGCSYSAIAWMVMAMVVLLESTRPQRIQPVELVAV